MVLVQFRVTVPDVERFRASCEKWGDPFQEDAGTVGLEWEARIWHRVL
jgi:hypothetical protein